MTAAIDHLLNLVQFVLAELGRVALQRLLARVTRPTSVQSSFILVLELRFSTTTTTTTTNGVLFCHPLGPKLQVAIVWTYPAIADSSPWCDTVNEVLALFASESSNDDEDSDDEEDDVVRQQSQLCAQLHEKCMRSLKQLAETAVVEVVSIRVLFSLYSCPCNPRASSRA